MNGGQASGKGLGLGKARDVQARLWLAGVQRSWCWGRLGVEVGPDVVFGSGMVGLGEVGVGEGGVAVVLGKGEVELGESRVGRGGWGWALGEVTVGLGCRVGGGWYWGGWSRGRSGWEGWRSGMLEFGEVCVLGSSVMSGKVGAGGGWC